MLLPRNRIPWIALFLCLAAGGSAEARPTPAAVDTFETAAQKDRAETVAYFHENAMSPLATILREDVPREGWLTIGSAPDNGVVLADTSVAPHHARVRIDGPGFRVEALDPGAAFDLKGEAKREADLPPSTIGVGRFRVRLSYQNAPAVIVFDPARPKSAAFQGPTYWPYARRYRAIVPLARESRPDTVWIESSQGQPRPALRVGRFALRVDGMPVRLAAYRLLEPGVGNEDLGLFFMDATCGRGSYHGGRYVDVEKQPDGLYLVDLNRAYNPSCAYSPHYNCPIPPLENRLSIRIPAGESWSEEAH
ncbi:MAG: DUF1684 domain-containing protein [Candidatus Eisenbacteria bacterium]